MICGLIAGFAAGVAAGGRNSVSETSVYDANGTLRVTRRTVRGRAACQAALGSGGLVFNGGYWCREIPVRGGARYVVVARATDAECEVFGGYRRGVAAPPARAEIDPAPRRSPLRALGRS